MNGAVELILRSSAILLVGLAAAAALRQRSAALRHRVVALALFGCAAVVPLQQTVPAVPVAVLPAAHRAPAAPVTAVVVGQTAPAAPETVAAVSLERLLLPIWTAGVVCSLLPLLAAVWRVRRIARAAAPVRETRWTQAALEIAARRGIRRPFALLQTDAVDVLATAGAFRPSILLPTHARHWSEARFRAVLGHELAHVARYDWLVQIAADLLRAAFWFNPLVWIACRRLRREAERACDDEVLAEGLPPQEYAEHLLALARLCRGSRSRWASAMPMAHASTLERRITAMLDPRLDRRAVSRRAFALAGGLLLAVAIPVAAVRGAQTGPAALSGAIYDPTGAVLPAAALRAGQNAPAPLSGSIYDATGAVMPGVAVTLEDANQAKYPATSNATGRFEFPYVPPGRYVLAASLPGFRALRQEFELSAARDWDRAITLQVGDLRETITVRESRTAAGPSPAAPAASPVRIGGNIRAPSKVKDVKPVFPPAMRAAGREGVVPIEATIGVDGSVSSVRVLSAQVHPDFVLAAVDAVRQWRFTPTLLNGAPVEVKITVSVTFDLAN
jgi:TonB family protein